MYDLCTDLYSSYPHAIIVSPALKTDQHFMFISVIILYFLDLKNVIMVYEKTQTRLPSAICNPALLCKETNYPII